MKNWDDGATQWDDGTTHWDEIYGSGASVQGPPTNSGVGLNSNIVLRLQKWLPNGWFPNAIGTRIFATLSGFSANLSTVLAQITYVKLQTRIRTATDGFLDLISWDFFGPALPRNTSEVDNAFRARILANLLRPRATRQGMITTLTLLTGRAPRVVEPKRPMDCGGWGGNPFGGYGVAGAYTNPAVQPFQAAIVAYRGNNVPDSAIYAAIDEAKPIATIMWTALSD
ncbi:hypothetical protein PQR71_39930 [Paraburkholderia fungorum]|uniref:hypothetical protein n=1 Tax=Paraburkholderia fungorum TaxID=134537 RepID=UPI0038BC7C4B